MEARAEVVIRLLAWCCLFVVVITDALAHHETIQRSGRQHFYDPACCSDKDCYPVEASFIKWTPVGWLITDTGQIIKELDSTGRPNPQIRISRDNQNHICRPEVANELSASSSAVVCIYIAPSGN